MSLLSLDARWRRFNDETRNCPCCGRSFSGIYDIGFDHPANWPHGDRGDDPFVKVGDDQLSPDLCRVGESRLIRAVLTLPVQGTDESVHITPWVQMAPPDFYAYLETWDDPGAPLPAPVTATLANNLPGFDEGTMQITLSFPGADQRPVLTATGGALKQAQTGGISFDQLLDLYAACGDDIRPHLTQD